MNTLLRKVLYSVPLTLSYALAATAQVATGAYAYGTYDNKGFDTINVGSLNDHFSIPVINKAGRGLPFYYNLSYDSSVWFPTSVNGATTWTPVANFGWRGDTEIATGYISHNTISLTAEVPPTKGGIATKCPYTIYDEFVYHDTLGASHPFSGDTVQSASTGTCASVDPAPVSSLTATATDGSGYVLNISDYYLEATLTSPSGKIAIPPFTPAGQSTLTDANGNQVSVNASGQFTDTTGTVVLTIAGAAPSPHTFTYTDTNGNSQAAQMTYKAYTVQTAFGCSGVSEYGPTSTSLVSAVTLPDGSTYSFTYEPTPGNSANVTGRLASVVLPSGGTIDYSYSGGSNGIECGDGSTASLTRSILSSGNSAASTWTYTRTVGSGVSQTAVTDGLGNQSSYAFVLGAPPSGQAYNWANNWTADYYETSRVINQGSSTTLLSRATCYNAAAQPCTTTALTLPISQIDTYETLNGSEEHGNTLKFNTYGLETEEDDYDFGTSARGALLHKEVWTYPTSGIVNLVSEDEAYDGSGNVLLNKLFSYDGGSLTATSGLPQHVAVTGQRGNLTGINQHTSTTASVNSSFTYDDTGEMLTSVDPNGNKTSYAYDLATNAFLGTIKYPTPSSGVAISASSQYNTVTGTLESITDQNSQVTTYASYDELLRPTQINFPDSGKATYSYSPTQISVSRLRQTGNSITTVYNADAYGRQYLTTLDDPEGNDLINYTYDANGNLSTVTNPHRSTTSGTDGTTTYSYDALGRITGQSQPDGTSKSWNYSGNAITVTNEVGSKWKRTFDGLGRLTQVLEPSPTSQTPTLETDYTYSGLTTTVNQKGISTETPRARSFTSDLLGRMILEVTPESGTTCFGAWTGGSVGNGTCQSGYDANSNLIKKTDARNVVLSMSYDSLNRLLSQSSSDGSISNTYSYDWSGNGSSGIGRLYGAFGANASTGFYYDSMGRITGKTYNTPASNGWQQAFTAVYDLAGEMTSLTYPDGLVLTQTWDNAGHLTSDNYASYNGTAVNYSYLTSASYYPGGAPQSMTFGNGVTQTITGNSRMQTAEIALQMNAAGVNQKVMDKLYCYGPAVSGSPGCSNYNLNNNGNVLAINDALNTGRSQTFAYDNLNRMTSFASGDQTMSQGFAYDSFGNMNQNSGTSQSNLSFGSNNQISDTGFSYDPAGNLTQANLGTSPYEQLTYDGVGRLLSINSEATEYIYDAEGNRVRKNTGSSPWTEYVYFNGQPYAQHNSDGSWFDYIYAGGQRIARAENEDIFIHTHGTTPGGLGASWNLPGGGYVIKANDQLVWRQLQSGGYGGPNIVFVGGTQTYKVLTDNSGQVVSSWQNEGAWGLRSANLTNYAGKTVANYQAVTSTSSPAGTYDIYYADMAIISTDGTITPIYYRRLGDTIPNVWNQGQTNLSAVEQELASTPGSPQNNTTYYQGDAIGSARILTAIDGWPVSTDTFYPFGLEQAAPAGDNTYKFTGLERDSESSLDHATFRQYAYLQGRWMSPDPYDGSYDFTNPQSLNRYSYALNNPLSFVDPSGLACVPVNVSGSDGDDDDDDDDGGSVIYIDDNSGGQPCSEALNNDGTPGATVNGGPPDPDPDPVIPVINGSFGITSSGLIGFVTPNNGTKQVPVHGFWTYGNHCGPGGMGTPIDALDTACQAHDACYEAGGFTALSNLTGSSPGLQACNQALCNAAWGVVQNSGNSGEGWAAMEVVSYFSGFANIIRSGNRCNVP